MSEQIKVTVVEFSDRKHYQLQWKDPMSGRKKTKSSKVELPPVNANKRVIADAEKRAWKAAGDHEKLLAESGGSLPEQISWADFRDRYEREYLASLADATFVKVCGAFNKIEYHLAPKRLSDLTAPRISHLQAKLRSAGLADPTIKGILAHIRAALNWAKGQGLLSSVPNINNPKRAKVSKSMKGRPITLEEFERMLTAVPKVVGEERAESWKHYLRGLFLSGLRLEESLNLYWDRRDMLCVELDGKRPVIWIPGDRQKSGVDTLAPVAPEFAEFLLATPDEDRKGRVFKPAPERQHGDRMGKNQVSRIICRIGKAAGVKVDQKGEGLEAKIKYASAHDLRRSFGERWATRVMPQVLQELMRHEQIETTLKFYVGRNAQRTADVLWAAHDAATASNTLGNTCENPTFADASDSSQAVEE